MNEKPEETPNPLNPAPEAVQSAPVAEPAESAKEPAPVAEPIAEPEQNGTIVEPKKKSKILDAKNILCAILSIVQERRLFS